MNEAHDLVLDANILLRAILGNRVTPLLDKYSDNVNFFCPEICFADARKHISYLADRHGFHPGPLFRELEELRQIVQIVSPSDYGMFEAAASDRIRSRDLSDWPIVATCLLLNAPLWTEDRDFFGCGLATWTTINVELYLQPS